MNLNLDLVGTRFTRVPNVVPERWGRGGTRPYLDQGFEARNQVWRILTLTALLLAQLSTLNPQLRAADVVWTNTASGNWGTAANWNPNQVPGSADNARITQRGTCESKIAQRPGCADVKYFLSQPSAKPVEDDETPLCDCCEAGFGPGPQRGRRLPAAALEGGKQIREGH